MKQTTHGRHPMQPIATLEPGQILEDVVQRDRVLVVDSSLEFVGTRRRLRAANLLLKGKAYELLPRQDSSLEHESFSIIGNPLVLALHRYTPKRITEIDPNSIVSKRMILNRDGYKCSYCGRFGNTVDHIIPKSQGGPSSWGNLTTACTDCNGKKGDLSLAEAGYKAPRIPKNYVPKRNQEIQEAIYRRLAEMSY